MKYLPLGEVCQVNMGQAPDGASYNVTGAGWPLIAGAGDFGYCTPMPKKFTSEPTKLSEVNDIILCIRATIGDLNWSDKSYCLGRGVAGLRPMKSKLDSHYLWHFISANKKKLAELGTGSTFKQISRSNIETFAIPLPPLDEQRRIAAILDKADAILRKRQESIHLCDMFIRSTFLDMFGDPVTNPKGWKVASLGNIAQIQGGLQVSTKRAGNPLEIPYLRVANVYRDKLNLTEIKSMPVTQAELERVKLRKGDILVVEGHGNPEEIGRSSVWDASIDPCIHQNHLIRVRLDPGVGDPVFISAYINSPGGRQQLFSFGKTTSGLNTISTSNVKATQVLVPPLSAQNRYRHSVEIIKKIQTKANISSELENHFFHSLTHRAFMGEL